MRRMLLWASLAPALASATVQYTVRPDVPGLCLQVSVSIEHPKADETFQIPGWTPGFYVMEHFEQNISALAASSADGKRLRVEHPEARTWTVHSDGGAPITVSYRVAGNDPGLGFFGASVKSDSAYYNGPSTYLYAVGRRDEAVSLHIDLPQTWRVATALDAVDVGDWKASDYDELADYPVQMGHFEDRKFKVQGIPFEIACVVPPDEKMRFDLETQAVVMRKVSAPAIQLFGSAPFARYLYILHLTSEGFQGGLEHRAGAVLATENVPGSDIGDLVAHEEFHAWNVKQIRPRLLGPFDYTQPQRTGALWFAEGVTDYYAKLLTYRSGVHDAGWLMDQLGDQVAMLQGGRTRLGHTVEEASRNAWENGGFNMGDLDYYNKGLLAGLLLDAEIRNATHGRKSLDDVMRAMYNRYRLPQPGYDEDGILRTVNEVAGVDLSASYALMIRTTGEMPFQDVQAIGLRVVAPDMEAQLPGGWPLPSESVPQDALARLGIRETDAFQGFAPSESEGNAVLELNRDGSTVRLSLPLRPVTAHNYEVMVNPTPTADQAAQLARWLQRPKGS